MLFGVYRHVFETVAIVSLSAIAVIASFYLLDLHHWQESCTEPCLCVHARTRLTIFTLNSPQMADMDRKIADMRRTMEMEQVQCYDSVI